MVGGTVNNITEKAVNGFPCTNFSALVGHDTRNDHLDALIASCIPSALVYSVSGTVSSYHFIRAPDSV